MVKPRAPPRTCEPTWAYMPKEALRPEGLGAWPTHQPIFPIGGHPALVRRAHERIALARIGFVADLRSAIVFEANLPEEISGEASDVAALLDIAVDRLAHFPGPIFIMADEHDAGIMAEEFGIGVEIVLARIVDRVAVRLRPHREAALIGRPSRHSRTISRSRECRRTRQGDSAGSRRRAVQFRAACAAHLREAT